MSLDDPSGDDKEDTWDQTQGAVLLANIDDDTQRCAYTDEASNLELAACNDAADSEVNGDDDLADLARLKVKPWPDAPETATGRLEVSAAAASRVRLFVQSGQGGQGAQSWIEYPAGTELTGPQLREGVSLAIEAKDIVRDPSAWDGYVDLTWAVRSRPAAKPVTDTVRMRVSPVMTFSQVEPAETLYVTQITGDQDSTEFQNALQKAASAAGMSNPINKVSVLQQSPDQWTQDFFEPAWEAMPGADGGQQIIRINYRSANLYDELENDPLRPWGRVVYQLRGKDVGAIEQYDPTSDPGMDSLNSFGNTETIPPYALEGTSYPLGRQYRGSVPDFHPDPSFTRLLEAQRQQPPVYVDTSWLLVGHVDETVSFLKVNSPRGWIALVNDAALARKMLEDEAAAGNGSVKMFEGQYWYDANWIPIPASASISKVLSDTEIMNESASSAAEVDAQLAILKKETGITEAEIVRVPFLHQPVDGYSVAYMPGTVNLLSVNETTVVVPDPHGPVINGEDPFKKQLEHALEPWGITIQWVDDWALYHALDGEVHCGTNAARSIPAVKWWETGR